MTVLPKCWSSTTSALLSVEVYLSFPLAYSLARLRAYGARTNTPRCTAPRRQRSCAQGEESGNDKVHDTESGNARCPVQQSGCIINLLGSRSSEALETSSDDGLFSHESRGWGGPLLPISISPRGGPLPPASRDREGKRVVSARLITVDMKTDTQPCRRLGGHRLWGALQRLISRSELLHGWL